MNILNSVFSPKLRLMAKSKVFDLIGIIIIVLVAWQSGYLFENLNQVTHWGGMSVYIPFGIISAFASVLSIMSTRLVGRFSNIGNWIGIPEIILSGTIDYLLGNKGAILTYPITFIIQTWAIKTWLNSEKYKARKPIKGTKGALLMTIILIGSLAFSLVVNKIGFGAITSSDASIFILTVFVFGISMTANIMNAMKLTVQWKFWLVYDFVQFFKALSQGNFANVGKYIYYVLMSLGGLAFWNRK
ncbi:hypothetical protein WR164_13840 [Philodulcilactobacillus myokoensis]|uniref:Nicotinamide mononucleotide transporter n=1 Tax=Philodulcilactobacillus myokoensis TaxID=2929573 RepID=A0A9W6ET35_9LACO|nr:nicotinamide mononucleotide transporter [Philodulcilactobacillus myokoensis]GLB47405.1 hypothetical protein WR164_13840 [Philodulcilactobacillus myokoensis]